MNTPQTPASKPARFKALTSAFHAYARWLVDISWKRFFVLALLLLICAGILAGQPFLSIDLRDKPVKVVKITSQEGPRASEGNSQPQGVSSTRTVVVINEKGVQIDTTDKPQDAASEASVSAASSPSSGKGAEPQAPDPDTHETHDVEDNFFEITHPFVPGELLMDAVILFILASMILKIAYKAQIQAEQQASEATAAARAASALAEAEQLRRQLVEARIATMQAQIEPHFLFNTLASIEHLIQTDPDRAQKMQQHLIDLLRASMPQLREAIERPLAPLGREMDMVRPYLAIQKIRMEERLDVRLSVPEGLLSAELPPLMLQTLVENAIQHGLEPQPAGGFIEVGAQVRDGQLVLEVSDNGAGLNGFAATSSLSSRGTGLHNIRERLQLHYGNQAALEVQARAEGGTLARLKLPYRLAQTPPATSIA